MLQPHTEENGIPAQVSHPIEDVIADVRNGRMVVVTDDARRENEGDLILAAEKVTPEAVNFMIRNGCGLLCIAMDKYFLERFGLARMSSHGAGDPYRTAFMESVDARDGITTGISAADRARTVQVLMDDNSTSDDIVRPGHLFPLCAVEDGVLRRAGHTEAAVDLARIAGLKPAGLICEVLNEDGSMARLPDLLAFAREHDLKVTTVQDIANYRKRTEKLISFDTEVNFPTDVGMFRLRMYHSVIDDRHHLALVMGEPSSEDSTLIRVHSECLTGDAFGSLRCDCGSQLREAMQMIAREGSGVLLYLRQEGRGIGLEEKLRAYSLQEKGLDTVQANEQLGYEADERDYAIAAQILVDLGVRTVRLITNNPRKISGLEAYGLRVADRVPLVFAGSEHSRNYLSTKKEKLGHLM